LFRVRSIQHQVEEVLYLVVACATHDLARRRQLYDTTLASSITPLEQDYDALPGRFDPVLHDDEFSL
jgi:hypothetical protein